MKFVDRAIVAAALAFISLTGCEKNDPASSDPPPVDPVPTASPSGFRTLYTSPSTTTTFPGAIDVVGNSYQGFASPGPDQPMWVAMGGYFVTLTRLDTAGQVMVTKRLFEGYSTLQATADGGCLLGTGSGIIRLNAAGEIQWGQRVEYDSGYGYKSVSINLLAAVPGGGNVFVGTIHDGQEDNLITGKITNSGQVEWVKSYAFKPLESNPYAQADVRSVAVLPDGRFITLGYRAADAYTFLTGFSPGGEVEWSKAFNAPGYGSLNSKLLSLPQGTVLVVSTQAGKKADNQFETFLVEVAANGTLLRARAIAGLNQDPGGVGISRQGAVTLVGHEAANMIELARAPGLYIGELNAQWELKYSSATSLENDPKGKWFSGYGVVLNADGDFRYTLGNLIAPINGGISTSFRMLKSKAVPGRVCSATTHQVPLSVKSLSLVEVNAAILKSASNLYRQYEYAPGIRAFNMQGQRVCE
jgi:hypothetical protein